MTFSLNNLYSKYKLYRQRQQRSVKDEFLIESAYVMLPKNLSPPSENRPVGEVICLNPIVGHHASVDRKALRGEVTTSEWLLFYG